MGDEEICEVCGGLKNWKGFGTALKPAFEPIIVARKPLQGTVAENVLRWGTGAINVDGCRVGVDERTYRSTGVVGAGRERAINLVDRGDGRTPDGRNLSMALERQRRYKEAAYDVTVAGRWPANVIHDGSEEVIAGFPVSSGGAFPDGAKRTSPHTNNCYGKYGDNEQPARKMGDTGSASRFFYCAKASKADRDEGCEGLEGVTSGHGLQSKCATCGLTIKQNGSGVGCECGAEREQVDIRRAGNYHPTVKPTSLMRYLCRLVTPRGGVILDPFMGSGSTGKAAILEGFNFAGIEREAEYVEIANARIAAACERMGIAVESPLPTEARRDVDKQLVLL